MIRSTEAAADARARRDGEATADAGDQAEKAAGGVLVFRVYGTPKGQPRPRARAMKFGGKVVARVYNPTSGNSWKDAVAIAAAPYKPAQPVTGPVRLYIDLLLPRPQRLCRKRDNPAEHWATCKPDVDNAIKGVMDSLTAIGWWVDDAQVVDCRTRKLYHALGDAPGARIRIEEIRDTPTAA